MIRVNLITATILLLGVGLDFGPESMGVMEIVAQCSMKVHVYRSVTQTRWCDNQVHAL